MKARIMIALGSLLLWTQPAMAADWGFKPSIAVSEEYTSNVFETAGNMRKEFITHVQPGFAARYITPRVNLDAAYTLDYRFYARNSRGNETAHDVGVRGSANIIDNLLFVDLSDTFRRVSLDVARDTTQESLFVNQSDQNVANVSPYLLWRLGGKSLLKTGYRYTDTRYWDAAGIDKREQGAFADLSYEVASRFSLTGIYSFSNTDTTVRDYDRHDASGGFRYEYADKSFLFGQIGNSWQFFDTGSQSTNLFWNAGITHDFTFLTATVESRVQNTEDPLAVSTKETTYSGRIDKVLRRGTVGLSTSYSEYENVETGVQDRRRLALGATGSYEVLSKLTASLLGNAERVSQRTAADFPYRFTGTVGLKYGFNYDLTVGLTYTYVSYRLAWDDPSGGKEISRAVVEVKKVF